MKYLLVILMGLIQVSMLAQMDYIYDYNPPSPSSQPLTIRAVEDNHALIFSGDFQPERLDFYLTKVDYTGQEINTVFVDVDNYYDVRLIDVLVDDGKYTLIGFGVNLINDSLYFLTIQCLEDLSQMQVIDQRSLSYPWFTAVFYDVIYNPDTDHYSLLFNIGEKPEYNKELLFVVFDRKGAIFSLESFGNGALYTDHIYNSDTKKHYMVANDNLIIYSEDKGIERRIDNFFIKLNDKRYFFIEYKIISADDEKINLLGRRGAERSLFTYAVYFTEDGWEQVSYNEGLVPDYKYYVLKKVIMPDSRSIISVSTDLLDGSYYDPNESYFYVFDPEMEVKKTYKIGADIKTAYQIKQVDKNCNILGIGWELITNKYTYFIMPCDNNYLVETDDVAEEPIRLEVYPNPTHNMLFLPSDFDNTIVTIYNLSGQKVFSKEIKTESDKVLDVTHLAHGSFILSVSKDGRLYHSKFIKI